jgi:quinol-cytochrome oxidoreductase complex cytochrome b subunit
MMPLLEKEKEEKTELADRIASSQIWRSIFRHGFDDTQRNRVLQMTAGFLLHTRPIKVWTHGIRLRYTWGAGGLTFLMFAVACITGVILMFYYRPVTEYAYADMKYLKFDIPFGMFMRNMHRWSAHAMVLLVLVHMLRVFLTGSYKKPREFNWVIGVCLLTLTLLLSFTGYLLPWDQLSMWAVTVGTNMARATPFLGHEGPFSEFVPFISPRYDARSLLLGGTIVAQGTLLRFYVLHCIVLPIFTIWFVMVHFYRIRKDGGISGPNKALEPPATPIAKETVEGSATPEPAAVKPTAEPKKEGEEPAQEQKQDCKDSEGRPE